MSTDGYIGEREVHVKEKLFCFSGFPVVVRVKMLYRTGEAKIYSSSARQSAHVQRCLSNHAMYVVTEVWAQPARC